MGQYMHSDYLLDESYILWVARMEGDWLMDLFYEFNYRYGKTYEGSILGRYPEKTNEVFVQNPLNTRYPELIYRTGDLGKWNEYGVCHRRSGRADFGGRDSGA